MAIATHTLAYIIIISFLIMILYAFFAKLKFSEAIPTYFISIVSTIIGFYFGGKLNNTNN